MTDNSTPYGSISTTDELGKLVRQHRKHKQMTLENISGLANLSVRFLSEFERGKETAEIGKVLKAIRTLGLEVIVQPRGHARTQHKRANLNPAGSPEADALADSPDSTDRKGSPRD